MSQAAVYDTSCAEIILSQIGGSHFATMTGAKHFVAIADGRGLQFKLPSNFANKRINIVRIILNSSDLYDVEYGFQRGINYKVLTRSEDVYCDMLKDDFERETGLYTNL